jgi:fatty-acyl-CoA synthase
MNLNDLSHGLPTRVVPREQTQALLDQRAAAAGLIKPKDRYTLADRLEHQAREQGERTFLIYGEQTLSYAEVDARANQMAHTF